MGILVYSLLWVMQDLYHQPLEQGFGDSLYFLYDIPSKPYSNLLRPLYYHVCQASPIEDSHFLFFNALKPLISKRQNFI